MREIEIGVLRGVRLKWRMREEIHQDAAGIVDQIAKALRDEDGVHVARRGLFELEQIVIGQRFCERDFDRCRRLVFVGNDPHEHGLMVLHQRGYFG